MKLKKGVLFVLEGIDGTGKTTQAKLLVEALESRGIDSVYFREPSNSRWGMEIKHKARFADLLTPEEELTLFIADRKENTKKNIKPALEAKKAVIQDRYYFSTIAYQGAKGIDPESIRRENEAFAVLPDLVFILDMDPASGLARVKKRGERDLLFEREDYLARVRKIFRSFKGEHFAFIDAAGHVEDIAGEIERIAWARLQKWTTG